VARPPVAAATYDASARSYAGALSVNAAAARRLIASLPLTRVDTVIDLGCGTGFASLAAIDLLTPADVVGVDASAEMLGRYREATRTRRARVRSLEAPVGAVPLPDGAADLVVATMVLQWVDDRRAALAEAARLLARGGWFGLVVPAIGTDAEFHDAVRGLEPSAPEPWLAVESSRTISPETLLGLLTESGFDVHDWWVEERQRIAPPRQLVERMQLVGAHVFPVPGDDPGIWHRVEGALEKRASAAGFGYTFRKLFVTARRRS
jgi:ubiquinone/menaquinone biosynthesis C-methylase UbiE